MKRLDGPEAIAEAIRQNQQLLAAIQGDLDRMPAFKTGTPWHLDRAREKQHLLARREMLRGFIRDIAATN
jgi:hypothetical protein